MDCVSDERHEINLRRAIVCEIGIQSKCQVEETWRVSDLRELHDVNLSKAYPSVIMSCWIRGPSASDEPFTFVDLLVNCRMSVNEFFFHF